MHVLRSDGGDGDGVRMPPRFFSAACVWQVQGLPRGQPPHHARHSCPPSRTNVPNDLAVNGTRDAVLQLEVHLGDGVLGEDRGVRDVTCWRRLLARDWHDRDEGVALVQQKWQRQSSSLDVRIAADSTMLRMVNLLMALSLGVHREQLEQRMGLTWPRPFLLRPLFFLCSRSGRSASIDQVGVHLRARLMSVGQAENATERM